MISQRLTVALDFENDPARAQDLCHAAGRNRYLFALLWPTMRAGKFDECAGVCGKVEIAQKCLDVRCHEVLRDTRCLIPRFDGVNLSKEWKDALWDKFVTAAPRTVTRQTICMANLPSGSIQFAGPPRNRNTPPFTADAL